MIQRIHSTRTLLVLLIVAMTVTTGAGAAELAYAVTKGAAELAPDKKRANEILQQTNNEEIRKRLRKENDEKSKMREPLYLRQAVSLAKHYRETAAIVARQGGDPQPLLDAAAYFEGQSK